MPYLHEAVHRRDVVPGAEQEEGEAGNDQQAAQVHHPELEGEEPETGAAHVHWDVQPLERNSNTQ